MSKWIYLLVFILMFLTGYGIILIKKPPTIHIFFEHIGTSSALGQMIKYVQLDSNEIKIVGWHRSPPVDQAILKDENTFWIELPKIEGNYAYGRSVFIRYVYKIMQNYPESPVIIYTGMQELPFLQMCMETLKGHNIRHVHMWEDGFFYVVASAATKAKEFVFNKEKFLKIQDEYMNGKIKKLPIDAALGFLFPVTYHIAGAQDLNKPDFAQFNAYLNFGNKKVEDFNIYQVAKKLTRNEKKLLFKLSGFDYDKFKYLKGKDFYLFTTGHVHNNESSYWKESPENMMRILNSARKGLYSNIPANALWGFKLHPSLGIDDLSPYILQAYPDMVEIPSHVPYEILILADINPVKIVGCGSSFFYWLHPEQILKYISHPYYDSSLIDRGIVAEKDLIYPHIPAERKSFENGATFKTARGKDVLIQEYNPNRFCRKNNLFECGFLKKVDDNLIRLKWDRGGEETFVKQSDGVYQFNQSNGF